MLAHFEKMTPVIYELKGRIGVETVLIHTGPRKSEKMYQIIMHALIYGKGVFPVHPRTRNRLEEFHLPDSFNRRSGLFFYRIPRVR